MHDIQKAELKKLEFALARLSQLCKWDESFKKTVEGMKIFNCSLDDAATTIHWELNK